MSAEVSVFKWMGRLSQITKCKSLQICESLLVTLVFKETVKSPVATYVHAETLRLQPVYTGLSFTYCRCPLFIEKWAVTIVGFCRLWWLACAYRLLTTSFLCIKLNSTRLWKFPFKTVGYISCHGNNKFYYTWLCGMPWRLWCMSSIETSKTYVTDVTATFPSCKAPANLTERSNIWSKTKGRNRTV